jgi:3'-5' exoribonuclease
MEKKDFFDLINLVDPTRREKLIQMFEDLWPRFSACPASTKYHGSYKGGLVDHTVQVVRISIILYNYYKETRELSHSIESFIFCALVHDIGKIGTRFHDLYLFNEEKIEYNTKEAKIDHELLSLFWLSFYGITVSEDEMAAIYHHAGPYVDAYKKVTETELMMILHSADNLTAKVGKI